MRILIAWELGDNYGHILRQLPVARQLHARGHDVLFVVKNVLLAAQILSAEGFAFVQAPVPQRKHRLNREIASFADILRYLGFEELDVLRSITAAWQHLYRCYQPDVVIIEHAPAALFAAHLSGIRTNFTGTGFESPPAVAPYPCFRPWLNLTAAELLRTEVQILANLNQIRKEQGQPPLACLSDLMHADVQLLVTFPELDHYPHRKNAQYLGPLFAANDGQTVSWPVGHSKNVFVYIRANGALLSLLDTLAQTDANIVCVVPDIAPPLKAQYETTTFHIYSSRVNLASLLKQCHVAVTHAGHGTIAACLLAGVPMLVVPTQIEQKMLAECVARCGMGLWMPLNEVSSHCAAALRRLLADQNFTRRARALAENYKTYEQRATIEQIVNAIEQLFE